MLTALPPLLCLLCGTSRAQEAYGSLDRIVEGIAAVHLDQPPVQELQAAALEGILLWLEQHEGGEHLVLLDRQTWERRMAYARGERVGVGIGVLLVPGYGIRILEVFPGTPADRAGLFEGDVIVAVDGAAVEECQAEELPRLLSVEGRSQVLLEIVDRQGVPRSVALEPEAYTAPALAVSDGEGHRMLRVHHFGNGSSLQLWKALQGVPGDHRLVIDLRDVRDGSIEEVVAAAAPFLGAERLACYRSARGDRLDPIAVPAAPRWDGPVALLVNAGTEGVAELFAAMIQRVNRQVTLVGTATAGVDVLPFWLQLGPDRVLQIAGTRLVLADGTSWGRVGVVPDVAVQAVAGSQLVPPPAPPADLQVDAAIQAVSAQ